MTIMNRFLREDRGQDLVEYTLLIVAAAFTGLALITIIKPALSAEWVATSTAIKSVETVSGPS